MSGALRRRWNGGHLQLILDLAVLASRVPERDPGELAVAAARGGFDSIQVRAKPYGAGALLGQTLAVIEALRHEGLRVPVLVNERLDVALLAGADGVHLPENSLNPIWARSCKALAGLAGASAQEAGQETCQEARQGTCQKTKQGIGQGTGEARLPFIVGRSIHTASQAAVSGTEALDYVLFGHVYPTDSKPGVPPRGLSALSRTVSVSPVPVLAVGGITEDNAAQVIEAGAAGIGVISAISDALDPFEAAKTLRHAVDAALARRGSAS